MGEPDKLEEILDQHEGFLLGEGGPALKVKRMEVTKQLIEAHFREKYLAMLPEKRTVHPMGHFEDCNCEVNEAYNEAVDEMRERISNER